MIQELQKHPLIKNRGLNVNTTPNQSIPVNPLHLYVPLTFHDFTNPTSYHATPIYPLDTQTSLPISQGEGDLFGEGGILNPSSSLQGIAPPMFPPFPPLLLASTSSFGLGFPPLPAINQSNQSTLSNPPILPSILQQQMTTIQTTSIVNTSTTSQGMVSQGPSISITPSIAQTLIVNTTFPLITMVHTLPNPPPPPPKHNMAN